MKTIYNLLFNIHFFVTLLMAASLVYMVYKNFGTPELKTKDIKLNVSLLLFFAITSFGVYYLEQHNRQTLATLILSLIWLGIFIAIIYAASKARWN